MAAIPGDGGNVIVVAYSTDGSKLASGGTDNMVRVWNASRLRSRGVLRGNLKRVNRVTFSPSGKTLVSASEDATAKVWDVDAEVERFSLGHAGAVNSAIFSSDGNQIITAGEDKKIKLWDSRTGRPLRTISS